MLQAAHQIAANGPLALSAAALCCLLALAACPLLLAYALWSISTAHGRLLEAKRQDRARRRPCAWRGASASRRLALPASIWAEEAGLCAA